MHNFLSDPELYYQVQGYIAFGIGVIISLLILIPSIKKKRRAPVLL